MAIEGTLAGRIAQLRAELDARGLATSSAFLFCPTSGSPPGWRDGDRHPVLSGPPAAREAGEAQMLEVRRRARVVHAHPQARSRPRHRQRVSPRRRRQRQHTFGSPSQPYPEFYTPKPYSKSFVLASRFLVRAKPSRRGLRRDVRRLADAEQRMASALRRMARSESSNTWTA